VSSPRSAVFDCNVFLQTMLSRRGASHACWEKVLAGEVTLFVTPYMLAEIRSLPGHPKLKRFSGFTPERVERFIEKLLDVAELIADVPAAFSYARDPEDAHYVDVALATHSMLVVSSDKDLLDLMSDNNQEGRELRQHHPDFLVLTPPQFLTYLSASGDRE
jgi:putative PIN family toxin of toxin-antitoxin system